MQVYETLPNSSSSSITQCPPSPDSSDFYFDQLPDISEFYSEFLQSAAVAPNQSDGKSTRSPSPPQPDICSPTPCPTPCTETSDSEDDEVEEVIYLSDEQQAILEEVAEGKSLFFTGSAGEEVATLRPRVFNILNLHLV